MAESVPERLRWAVDLLDVQPDDKILEIGPGPGAAAALVCERLTSGRYVGIDRSAKAVESAARRNALHVGAGRADFLAMALETADLDDRRFDKVFAVNVNIFWTHPGKGVDTVTRVLKPDGLFYMFYHPPSPERNAELADRLPEILTARGFRVVATINATLETTSALCVASRRA